VARKATIASGLLRLLADKICENNRRRRARARALQGAEGLFKSVFVERSGSILQQQASRVAFVNFFELFLGLFQCITKNPHSFHPFEGGLLPIKSMQHRGTFGAASTVGWGVVRGL
jgi:hypothetical protein